MLTSDNISVNKINRKLDGLPERISVSHAKLKGSIPRFRAKIQDRGADSLIERPKSKKSGSPLEVFFNLEINEPSESRRHSITMQSLIIREPHFALGTIIAGAGLVFKKPS